MAIGVALLVLVLGLMFASGLSQGKSAKRKYSVGNNNYINHSSVLFVGRFNFVCN
ncbi:hypothetical protein PQ796_13695 [Priestia megaterium]|uniref:hypothetical protein n=1 Tax=Priestia TaxID=2800373 RepID=UPI001FCEB62B|nr:hypothetical protein [Priestia megaterium]MDH2451580.1 hypothetical protein [Priestia megaterium]